ncbi:MAG: helix-hairpin-helix domain-containing protein, partial [Cyclobacteriaceae bacterium]|nr:helix-hairpin-helix domain-containing protein [Cyclobacteriaceae bacterium]
ENTRENSSPENDRRSLSVFDPNKVSFEYLSSVGIEKNIAHRWLGYRQKGGHFNKVEEVKKIYGITDSIYHILEPFMIIPKGLPTKPGTSDRETSSSRTVNTTLEKFDLNLADTLSLSRIQGIGKVLSKRITKYRDLLGGFISEGQLYEIYGLDSTVAERLMQHSFIAEPIIPKKININIATKKELSAHPYISFKMADLIIAYRVQHGQFTDLSILKNIPVVAPHFQKISPYLAVKD